MPLLKITFPIFLQNEECDARLLCEKGWFNFLIIVVKM